MRIIGRGWNHLVVLYQIPERDETEDSEPTNPVPEKPEAMEPESREPHRLHLVHVDHSKLNVKLVSEKTLSGN